MGGGSQRAGHHQTEDLKEEAEKECKKLQGMGSREPQLEIKEALLEAECEAKRLLQLLRDYRQLPKPERVL